MARQYDYEQQRRLADMRLRTALVASIPELSSYAEHELVVPLPNFSNSATLNAYKPRGRKQVECLLPIFVTLQRIEFVAQPVMAAEVTLVVGNNPHMVFDHSQYTD